jgi:photosystem II stability/assembly factor-like uncharacterized protein
MRPLVLATTLILSTFATDAFARGRVTRPPATWGMPVCDPYRVGASFWYTVDNAAAGLQLTAMKSAPQDLAVSEVANLMFAVIDGNFFESADAGCAWTSRSSTPVTRVVAAAGGRAYAWSDTTLVRVSRERVDAGTVPDRVLTLAADPDNADRLFALSFGGTAYSSLDGGTTWERRGTIARTPLRAAAIDPFDFNHAIAGGTAEVHTTSDGGRTWTTVASPDAVTISSIVFSAAAQDLVWMVGHNVYRSQDGGATFARVLRSAPLVPITPASRAAVHPQDAALIAFTTVNGFAILDSATNTTRVSVMSTPPESLVWSPDPRVIYVTNTQISTHVY